MKIRRNRKPRRTIEEKRKIYDEFMDGAQYHTLREKYMIGNATICQIIQHFDEELENER